MKAKVLFAVEPSQVRQWNGKNVSDVLVEADGLRYRIFAVEGSPAWALKKDEEVDIEVTEQPTASGPGKAKLAGQQRQGGGGWTKREALKPNPEYAKELAIIAVATYRSISEHAAKAKLTPELTSEDIRSMVNTILIRI